MGNNEILSTYRGPPTSQPPGLEESPAGKTLFSICWRRRWTVLTCLLLTMIAAGVYLAYAPRVYTSRARFHVQENGPRLLTPNADTSISPSDAYQYRQCEVIKADPILTQALLLSHSDTLKTFDVNADPLTVLQKNLSVDVGKKDDIITVQFGSQYREEAATVVNAVVAAYQSYASDQTQSSANRLAQVLRREKDVQEAALDAKLKAIATFKRGHAEMFFTNERGMNLITQNLSLIDDSLMRARLAATRAFAALTQSNSRTDARREWLEADAEVRALDTMYAAEKAKAAEINSAQAEFQKLQVESERLMKVCDALDVRLKEVSVTENSGGMNIQLLETGKAEELPSKPNNPMILAAAVLAGLVAGAGVSLLREVMDQRVYGPDESGRLLGLQVLAMIPRVSARLSGGRQQLGRVVQWVPNSHAAEAFRSLSASVSFGWPDRGAHSVLVTSPERGDGKSTSASNLAISMAQAGQRTLLIDADLRSPVQHKLFDVSNDCGLTDVVARGVPVERAMQATDVHGLSLLPSGPPVPNPSEIANSQLFGRLLHKLEAEYDLIIIDSPPLLAVADARVLGAQAGLTILVLRAERTTRQHMRMACQQLLNVGSNILGVVLNGTPAPETRFEYVSESFEPPFRRTNLLEPNGRPNRTLPAKMSAVERR